MCWSGAQFKAYVRGPHKYQSGPLKDSPATGVKKYIMKARTPHSTSGFASQNQPTRKKSAIEAVLALAHCALRHRAAVSGG